jgi:hypothetical protein
MISRLKNIFGRKVTVVNAYSENNLAKHQSLLLKLDINIDKVKYCPYRLDKIISHVEVSELFVTNAIEYKCTHVHENMSLHKFHAIVENSIRGVVVYLDSIGTIYESSSKLFKRIRFVELDSERDRKLRMLVSE